MIGFHIGVSTATKLGAACALLSVFYMQPYRAMMVVGHSMEPTYRNHSIEFTKPVSETDLERGMVVIIDTDTGPIVKRVAYAPGDLMMQSHVGGKWIDLVNVRTLSKQAMAKLHWRTTVVPQGVVYVLGDNADVSYDSRQFGYVFTNSIHSMLVDQRPFDIVSKFEGPVPGKSKIN